MKQLIQKLSNYLYFSQFFSEKKATDIFVNDADRYFQPPTEFIYTALSEWRTQPMTHIPWNALMQMVHGYRNELRKLYLCFVLCSFLAGLLIGIYLV